MPRVAFANLCRQEIRVTIAGKPLVLACTRGEQHPGDHSSRVAWPRQLAAPPPDRKA